MDDLFKMQIERDYRPEADYKSLPCLQLVASVTQLCLAMFNYCPSSCLIDSNFCSCRLNRVLLPACRCCYVRIHLWAGPDTAQAKMSIVDHFELDR